MSQYATPEHHPASSIPMAPSSQHEAPLETSEGSAEGNQSEEPLYEHVAHFTKSHHLAHRLDLFKKAAILVQGEVALTQIPDITRDEILAIQRESEKRWHQPKMLYFTILACSIGAIEQGWAQTAMNGANLYFPKVFGIDSSSPHDTMIVGLINSGIYLSTGLMGAWLSEPINNRLGRRGAIFVGSVLCLLANLGGAASQSWLQLLAFRVVLGAGLGIDASTVSVYAAECAPPTIRGGLAVSWQMWTAFGIFLGFVANVAVYNFGSRAWRLQLAAAFIPTVPLLLIIYTCPESPAWHIKKNARYDLAFRSLCRLRNTELQAARELYLTYLQRSAKSKTLSYDGEPSFMQKVIQLFTIPRNRRATQASYTVMLAQQLCGINIIAFYSSTIFAESGFSTFGALLASCIFGFVNFVGAFPAIWTMDTLGRRSLLLLTLPLMAVTMLAAGLSFSIPTENPLHFGLLATLIYLFCAEYSPGMGPVPSAYSAEIFPLSHREVGMSLGVATANLWAAFLSLTFPRLLSAWGARSSFSLYAGLNVVALVLVFLFVPETRLRSLDELDAVFSVPTRRFVRYQVTAWLPWFWRSYVLRRKGVELVPLAGADGEGEGGGGGRGAYSELVQDEDVQLSSS